MKDGVIEIQGNYLDKVGEILKKMVGILNKLAIKSNGPLAYPPVPITTWGLNFSSIEMDFSKLKNSLKGNIAFLNDRERCSPSIHRPIISYPASGTLFISILPNAPTNKIFVLG